MTTATSLSQSTLERKGRLTLRKLLRSGSVIRPLGAISDKTGCSYGLFNTRLSSDTPKEILEGSVVEAFLANDWLEQTSSGLMISNAGKYWLKMQKDRCEKAQEQGREHINPGRIGKQETLVANTLESPLAWLRNRKDKNGVRLLDAAQFEAGEILRRDYQLAQQTPRTTASWSSTTSAARKRKYGSGSGISLDLMDKIISSRRKVADALDYIGPELSGILINVCCHSNGLTETEKENGWPQRSGKIVLQIALSKLARYYKLSGEAGPENGGGPEVLSWLEEKSEEGKLNDR